MATGIMLLSLFAAIWMAAFSRWTLRLWSSLILGILLVFSFIPATSSITLHIAWILFFPIILILNIPPLRVALFSKWILKIFHKRMPSLSSTELAAIKAGDVWWEKELFCGAPDWTKLFSLPKDSLSDEEQEFIDTKVKKLCSMLNEWEIHQQQDLPDHVWEFIKKEKFFGMIIDKEYGGLGFSTLAHSTVITMVSSRSYTTAVNIMVPNSLGPAEFLMHYGTDEQKKHYLPKLATGEEVPCFALTSPTAGSDAASITDTGVVCEGTYQGKKTIGLRLNWNKRYITLAPKATLMGLAVQVTDPDHSLGDQSDLGISFCLVPTDLPGVTIGSRHRPLNIAFINGPTQGKDVFIPLDNIIGGVDAIGKGWEMMMASLSVGRAISLPAVSAGTAKSCYALTSAYAGVREQFGIPIGEFEGVKEALARIAGYTYMIEATRLFTLSAADSGIKPGIASAITKYHLTELNREIINHAMDIHGGRGIMMGEKNYLAQYYFSAPINITVEGANILTRNLIIFGQGAMRCHPFAADEIGAANNPDKKSGTARFDHLIFEHLGWVAGNFARSLFYGITGGRFIPVPKNSVSKYLKQMTRMSTALALVSDMAMMFLGGKLKSKERLSARLGDVLSQLYLASAIIKYFHDNNYPKEDEHFVSCTLKCCLAQAQYALMTFLANFKPSLISWILMRSIFFWGIAYKEPNDKDCDEIVCDMTELNDFRDRLLENMYRSDDPEDAANKMLHTFELVKANYNAYIKLKKARRAGKLKGGKMTFEDELESAHNIGVLTKEEVDAIRNMRAYQEEVIQVDDFK